MQARNLFKEEAFFHSISPKILSIIAKSSGMQMEYSYRKKDKLRLNVAIPIDVRIETIRC